MAQLKYPGLRRLRQSTTANAQFQPITYHVSPTYETATNLPAAGDNIEIAQFTTNMVLKSMKFFVPTGYAWGGGAVNVGWALDGPHPNDRIQHPNHDPIQVDETLFNEFTRFGTGITPSAAGAEAIVQPVSMLDDQYGVSGDWRGFDWNLVITPAAAPAADDRLLIWMEYFILAT